LRQDNLAHLLLEAVQKYPRRAACWSQRGSLSFQQMLAEVEALAGWLQAHQVGPGDRVLLLLPNWPHFVIACLALWWRGAVAVLTSPLLPPQSLIEQMRKAQPRVVITCNRLDPVLAQSLRHLGVEQILLTSGKEYLRSQVGWLFAKVKGGRTLPGGVARWRSALRQCPAQSLPLEVGGESPAAILFSGGTTGSPKGVVLSHRAVWSNVLQLEGWDQGLRPGRERILAALPLTHSYGLTGVMAWGLRQGATLILSSSLAPDHLAELASKLRPSLFPGTPALYGALLNLPNLRSYRFDSIRLCACGSAPLPREIREGFERVTKAQVVEGYGLTEAGPVTHVSPYAREQRKSGSVGQPLAGTEARIVDLVSRETLPPGQVGELVLRGPQLMTGYWGESSDGVLCDGWLYTGDLGRMDEQGFAYLLGRLVDCCELDGELIYPRRIEEAIYLHPAVQEAAVLAWPGGLPRGTRPVPQADSLHAFVVARPGKTLCWDDLQHYLQARLPERWRPRHWTLLPALPRTPFGKVSRLSLYGSPL
jgi:long-chain acyl-CoA synthetase